MCYNAVRSFKVGLNKFKPIQMFLYMLLRGFSSARTKPQILQQASRYGQYVTFCGVFAFFGLNIFRPKNVWCLFFIISVHVWGYTMMLEYTILSSGQTISS